MTPEAKTRAATIRFAAKKGVGYQRMSFRRGVKQAFPDDAFLIPGGRILLLEFKAPGKWPTPLQAYRLERLRELGYWATWAADTDAACGAIMEALGAAAIHAASGGPPVLKSCRWPTSPAGRS